MTWVGKVPKSTKKQYVRSWRELPEPFFLRMKKQIEGDGNSMSQVRALIDNKTGIHYILRPKVKWVNGWGELSSEKKRMRTNKVRPSEVQGIYSEDNNKIYALRGKTKDWQILHEEAHSRQRQRGSNNPKLHAYNEIKADMFAYTQIGKPQHNFGHLAFMYLELADRYNINLNQSLQCILDALRKAHAPREWFSDFDRLVKGHNKAIEEAGKVKQKKGKNKRK